MSFDDLKCYLYHEGRYLSYFTFPVMSDEIAIKVVKSQKHFDYFDNLFTSDDFYINVDYLNPGGTELESLCKNNDLGYLGGSLKLQLKDLEYQKNYQIYRFHLHLLDRESKHKEVILKSIFRAMKLDYILE